MLLYSMYTCGLTAVIKRICYVTLCYVGVQEQAEDILVPPPLRNCLTLNYIFPSRTVVLAIVFNVEATLKMSMMMMMMMMTMIQSGSPTLYRRLRPHGCHAKQHLQRRRCEAWRALSRRRRGERARSAGGGRQGPGAAAAAAGAPRTATTTTGNIDRWRPARPAGRALTLA